MSRFPSLLALLRAAAAIGSVVLAGVNVLADPPATADFSAVIVIHEEETQRTWTKDIAPWLIYHPATGDITLPDAGSELGGGWNWGTVDILDGDTGLSQTMDAMTWSAANGASVAFYQLHGNVDPFLSYGFAARNPTGATQTYTFGFGEAIVPTIAGNYSLYADIGGSITNAGTGSTAAVLPTIAAGDPDGDGFAEIQRLFLSSDGGVTPTNAGVDVGLGVITGTTLGTSLFGPESAATTGYASSALDYWEFQSSFTLSGGGDAVAFTGFAEIVAEDGIPVIPEPTAYAGLLGLGVLALAARRGRVSRLLTV